MESLELFNRGVDISEAPPLPRRGCQGHSLPKCIQTLLVPRTQSTQVWYQTLLLSRTQSLRVKGVGKRGFWIALNSLTGEEIFQKTRLSPGGINVTEVANLSLLDERDWSLTNHYISRLTHILVRGRSFRQRHDKFQQITDMLNKSIKSCICKG